MMDSRVPGANGSSSNAIIGAIEADQIPSRYIFGAKLASAIKNVFSVDIKANGGLKKYCEENVPNHVICLGKTLAQGGDNIFYVFDKTYDLFKPGWAVVDKAHSKKVWDFFTNPLINGRLAVSRTSTTIWATLNADAPLPSDADLVPKITPESLETLVQTFRAECSSEISTQAELAIASAAQIGDGIGRSWSNTVRLSTYVKLFKEWEQWLLRTQVAGLQVTMPYPSAPILESILISGSGIQYKSHAEGEMALRQMLSPQKKLGQVAKNYGTTDLIGTSGSPNEERARAVVASVMQHLSYDEIRELRLPFGLVFDALIQK